MKRLFASITLVLLTGILTGVSAQFQGQIEMKLHSTDNGKAEESFVNIFVTPERIMIKGEEEMSLNRNLSAGGLLIRHDMKDFIVLMGKNQALQVTKQEIEELMDMFFGWDDNKSGKYDQDNIDPGYRYTDRVKTINGFTCAEMVIEDESGDGGHLSVWLTPDIEINWGVLAEPWKNLPKDLDKEFNGMSQDVFFKGKNFPMLVEAVNKKGEVSTVLEVTNVNESNIARAMVQIPSNMVLVGAKEFIFKMMTEQQ